MRSYFLEVVSGGLSRFLTAPFDKLKISLQAGSYTGTSLKDVFKQIV